MKQRLRHGLLWCAALVWLALCFVLSGQTGAETAETSQFLAQILLRLLSLLGITPDAKAFHSDLRVISHFVVFFMAGTLVNAACLATLRPKRHPAVWTLISCGVCAVACEVVKLWIPGRHLQWDELGLNMLGVLCGTAVTALLYRVFKHRSR